MKPLTSRNLWIAVAVAAALCAAWQVHAESNRVKFPQLDKLVHYTTVKRGEVTEHMLTTPQAVAAVQGADYEERRRTGDRQFQWYWPDKTISTKETTARCQSCHQSQQDNGYLYTSGQLREYRPGRAP